MKSFIACLDRRWRHPLSRPVLALGFASLVACGLLAARIAISGHGRHLYLPWNLFLAWMPLCFALAADWMQRRSASRRAPWLAAMAAWLLFFPNAPYLLTDLIHLGPKFQRQYWSDLVLILLFALTGLVLGFLSLFLMQRLVARRHGWPMGWLFVGMVAALSGFGIYAGRFWRWNSWDVVFHPAGLLADFGGWLAGLPGNRSGLLLPALFAVLVFIAYVMLYALTHMSAVMPLSSHPYEQANSRRPPATTNTAV